MIPPRQSAAGIHLGGFRLESTCGVTPKISQKTIMNHESQPDTLYFIDYELENTTQFILTVVPDL